MLGKSINGFTLQRLLGTGGMAEVWYAESKIGTKAAVKIMSEKLSHDNQMQERFLNEAKVMVMLDHPNIRKVYSFDEIDGRPAIVMEYLEGADLKALMKSGRRFTDTELRKWWDQLVDALNYTHAQGIVHRDIKPSNIFIDQRGNARLLDFGIAKVADTTTGTMTGFTLGTRIYMSPEQVRDPKRVGPSSDVYSLAVSFLHLLTGKAPYDSTTSSDYDIQESIVRKPVDMSEVPAAWQDFLAPYLAKRPEDRPALRTFEATTITPPIPTPDADDKIVAQEAEHETLVSPQPDATVFSTSPQSEHAPLSPMPKDKPKSKKGLWIGLGAFMVIAAIILLIPKGSKQFRDYKKAIKEAISAVENAKTCDELREVGYSTEHILYGLGGKEYDEKEKMMSKEQREISELCEQWVICYNKKQDELCGGGKASSEPNIVATETPAIETTEAVEEPVYSSDLSITANGVTFTMKPVEGGTFQMGSYDSEADSDERPVHDVTVGSFYMCETEVTQALWEAVMWSSVIQQRDRYMPNGPMRGVGGNYPMYYVNRQDCQDFIRKLNNMTGRRFRLPTEAEWEFAARGGNQNSASKFAGSNSVENVAWCSVNSRESSQPVKRKSPNGLGLYDMSGNVWEWCSDEYDSGFYSYSPSYNPQCGGGQFGVVRGGSWYSQVSYCRVSKRHKLRLDYRDSCYGFRLVLSE